MWTAGVPSPLDSYSGAGDRDLPGVDSELAEVAGQRIRVPEEEEAWMPGELRVCVDQRTTAAGENAELADERLEAAAESGREHDRVGPQFGAVGEHHGIR